MAGCVKKDVELPKTQLPKQPLSTDIPCEDLSMMEENACLQTGPEARAVCRKVQRNKAICDDQQQFTRRLYNERDGK